MASTRLPLMRSSNPTEPKQLDTVAAYLLGSIPGAKEVFKSPGTTAHAINVQQSPVLDGVAQRNMKDYLDTPFSDIREVAQKYVLINYQYQYGVSFESEKEDAELAILGSFADRPESVFQPFEQVPFSLIKDVALKSMNTRSREKTDKTRFLEHSNEYGIIVTPKTYCLDYLVKLRWAPLFLRKDGNVKQFVRRMRLEAEQKNDALMIFVLDCIVNIEQEEIDSNTIRVTVTGIQLSDDRIVPGNVQKLYSHDFRFAC